MSAVAAGSFPESAFPERAIGALEDLVDAERGIVSRVVSSGADGTHECLPVCAAAILRRSGLSEIGFGKGLSVQEAVAGAIGEALEIYAGTQFPVAELRHESLSALAEAALDPRQLCLYDSACYRKPGFPYCRFDPELPIHWTPGSWLGTRERVWLPALPVFRDFPSPSGERFCQVTSNALATGRGLDDAVFRATLELIERDAFMLTWFAKLPATEILIDDQLDPRLAKVLAPIVETGANVELYLLDAGIQVPTVVCIARGDGRNWPGATLGLGTHPNPRVAVNKAILEMGQTGYNLCKALNSGEKIPGEPSEVRSFRDHALYYLPADRASAFDFLSEGKAAGKATVSLTEVEDPGDVSLPWLATRLRDAGVRVAIADLTPPDLRTTPFRVVRALGTDLQQIHCGWGNERTANPRLERLLQGPVNAAVPPVC